MTEYYTQNAETRKKILRGLKNVSYLTIGNIVSQIISFIGFVYIARFLGPNDYGVYTMVGAFVGMFAVFTFGGLDRIVLREGAKELNRMREYLEKASGIKELFALIAIIVCIIGSLFVPYSTHVRLYIVLFSFYLLYQSFNSFLGTIYQATEKMQYNAGLAVLNRILFVSLAIAFLHMGFGLLTLFLIALFSHFLTLVINFKLSRKFVNFKFWNRVNWDKSIVKPGFIFSLIGFLGFLQTKVDLVMVSFLGTPKDVGIYGIAFKIATMGAMLRAVTSTAFFPIIVKRFHKGSMKTSRLLKYSGIFFVGVFSVALVVSYFAKDLVLLAFGSEYEESGYILSVLIFYLAVGFATLPFTNAVLATNNEKISLIFSGVAAGMNIPLNYFLFLRYGLVGIAYSTLIVMGSCSLVSTAVILYVLRKQGHLV